MSFPIGCAAVIPCWNESATIASLVAAARFQVPDVLVVDDGSTDATARLAQEAGARIVRHAQSRGKGAALRTGWREARRRGFEWVLTLDGDGQHAPQDIPAFFRCAEQTAAKLIVGNRMTRADEIPWVRRQVNRWMSRRISKAAGHPLADTQCGFRLIELDALDSLALASSHFEIESEVLLGFARRRFKIEFVPVQVIYGARKSRIRPLADTVRWFRWLALARFQENPAPIIEARARAADAGCRGERSQFV